MKPTYPNTPLVAVRSLQSEHHANNLPPDILHVTWMLGKRCNYDCSYCTPHIHDAVSPHISLEFVQAFADKIDRFAQQNNRTVQFVITGGEPFIHPQIFKILQTLASVKNRTPELTSITNGSLTLDRYEKCLQYLSNLTISLHLEQSQRKIDHVINNIVSLHKNYNRFITVNLMCVAGKMNQWQKISEIFNQHNIKHVLRRIRPNFDENYNLRQPGDHLRDRSYAKLSVKEQKKHKNTYKIQRSNRLLSLYDQYYNSEELEWLRRNSPKEWYQNLGVWYQDGSYVEGNSDDLLTQDRTVFTGWTCGAGIDSIYIDFDGTIYRGYCGNQGEIGHISQDLTLPDQPTICNKPVCASQPDIVTRKCLPGYESLIGINTSATPGSSDVGSK